MNTWIDTYNCACRNRAEILDRSAADACVAVLVVYWFHRTAASHNHNNSQLDSIRTMQSWWNAAECHCRHSPRPTVCIGCARACRTLSVHRLWGKMEKLFLVRENRDKRGREELLYGAGFFMLKFMHLIPAWRIFYRKVLIVVFVFRFSIRIGWNGSG